MEEEEEEDLLVQQIDATAGCNGHKNGPRKGSWLNLFDISYMHFALREINTQSRPASTRFLYFDN